MSDPGQFTEQARAAIASGIPEDELFTPILNGERVVMRITRREHQSITRGPGDKGRITDQLTGKRFDVIGRSCGLPNCFCDSEVVPV